MRKASTILAIITIFTLTLSTMLFTTPQVQAQDSTEMNQLRTFLKDVLKIDTSTCTITNSPISYSDNRPELGTRGTMEGKVFLDFGNGKSVDGLYEFHGPFLTWLVIYYGTNTSNPLPYLKTPSNNSVEQARQFLENYQKFLNDSTIGDMAKLLDGIQIPHVLTKTSGNLKLDIIYPDRLDFDWSYTFEGEGYRILSINFASPPHIYAFNYYGYKYNMSSSAFPIYQPATTSAAPSKSVAGNDFSPSSIQLLIFGGAIVFAGAATTVLLVQTDRKEKRGFARFKRLRMFQTKTKGFKKKLLVTAAATLLILTLQAGWNMQVVHGNFMFPPLDPICITSEGTITPSSAPITQTGNLYTLTGPITNFYIMVQKDNIVIDGAKYLIQKTYGPSYGRQDAIVLEACHNVTVTNVVIQDYYRESASLILQTVPLLKVTFRATNLALL
jgi:hypothetical protein